MPAIRHDDLLLRLVKENTYIRSALRSVTTNLPLYDIASENTPAQLNADQNNYAPGNYDIIRLSSTLAVSITGLRGGVKGRMIRIFNDGLYSISLTHQSASSTAENRFKFSSGFSAIIPPGANVSLYYDATGSRWTDSDRNASGAVLCDLTKATVNIAAGAITKVTGFTVVNDYYGFYDAANSRIVIKFPGVYIITLSTNNAFSASLPGYTLALYKNTALYKVSYGFGVSEFEGFNFSMSICALSLLSINDVLEFYLRYNIGAGSTTYTSLSWAIARVY